MSTEQLIARAEKALASWKSASDFLFDASNIPPWTTAAIHVAELIPELVEALRHAVEVNRTVRTAMNLIALERDELRARLEKAEAERDRLAAKNANLTANCSKYLDDAGRAQDDADKWLAQAAEYQEKAERLAAENARLRAALEWYADRRIYDIFRLSDDFASEVVDAEIDADKGQRASAALAGEGGET